MDQQFSPNERLLRAFHEVERQANSTHQTPQRRVLLLTESVRCDAFINFYEGFTVQKCPTPSCPYLHLQIAVTREKVLPLFYALIDVLPGEIVDPSIVRPAFHRRSKQYMRDPMDKSTLLSTFQDHQDVLLHDGYSMISIDNEKATEGATIIPQRLLHVYAKQKGMRKYRSVVKSFGIDHFDAIDTVLNHKHSITTTPEREQNFLLLAEELGLIVDEDDSDWGDMEPDEHDEEY